MSSIEHLTPLKAKKAGRLVKMVDSRMRADTRNSKIKSKSKGGKGGNGRAKKKGKR